MPVVIFFACLDLEQISSFRDGRYFTQVSYHNIDSFVKSQNLDGKVKNSSSRRREFRRTRCTYVHRSEHEMKRNAEIGLFTKPSILGR